MGRSVSEMATTVAEAEAIQEKSIQEKSEPYVDDALKTLGAFSRGKAVNKKSPAPPTVLQAAKTLLEMAGGRPETRAPAQVADAGLTIIVQTFGTNPDKVIVHGAGGQVIESVLGREMDITDVSQQLSERVPDSSKVGQAYEVDG